jgi:hypothetical protein
MLLCHAAVMAQEPEKSDTTADLTEGFSEQFLKQAEGIQYELSQGSATTLDRMMG